MSRARKLAGVVLLATVVAAGCSSSSHPSLDLEGRKAWEPSGVRELRTLADRIVKAFPGECQDFVKTDFSNVRAANLTLGATVVPRAQTVCAVNDENLEMTLFSSDAEREKFIRQRVDGLCRVAKNKNVDLPGTRWVVGPKWSIQPDTEDFSRRLAAALGARYQPEKCPTIDLDWKPAGITRLNELGAALKAKAPTCDRMEIENHDEARPLRLYAGLTLPDASGKCTVDANETQILVFGTDTALLDRWRTEIGKRFCLLNKPTKLAVGKDWLAIGFGGDQITTVADALGGTVDPYTCVPAAAPAPSSTTAPPSP